MALAILFCVGCTPRMLDLQGRPIEHPAMTIAGPGVWGVVDTTAGFLRAVLEFDIEVPVPAAADVTGLRVSLGVPRVFAVGPRTMWMGAVTCPQPEPVRADAPDRPHIRRGGRAVACVRLVRVEFPLDRLPDPAGPLVLTVDDRDLALALTRVSPPPLVQR